ncbi:MAG: hypothetical protein RM338_03550 [Nostoc sp. DedQUE12a]|nr:hypothetical protein [Nostoc sp. DedQUE12a]
MISSSDNYLIIKISPRPRVPFRVSLNDKSSTEHDMNCAIGDRTMRLISWIVWGILM